MDPVQQKQYIALGANRTQEALDVLKQSVLTPKEVEQLQAKLRVASSTGDIHSATPPSQAVGRITAIGGYKAITGQIEVPGLFVKDQLDTLLSYGSYKQDNEDARGYAEALGYRIATPKQNKTYAESLLRKQATGSINEAESDALKIYSRHHVKDTGRGIRIIDNRIKDGNDRNHVGASCYLFVRSSVASEAMEQVQTTPFSWKDLSAPCLDATTGIALDILKRSVLTQEQVQQLQELLKTPRGVGRKEFVNSFLGIAGQIVVDGLFSKGRQLDTFLGENFHCENRAELNARVKPFGYRIATREESRTYAKSLLAKKANGSINEADSQALQMFENGGVADSIGKLFVRGWQVGYPRGGFSYSTKTLLVRDSAESISSFPPSAPVDPQTHQKLVANSIAYEPGAIISNGKRFDVLLGDASPEDGFGHMIRTLGFRLGSAEQHRMYLKDLLRRHNGPESDEVPALKAHQKGLGLNCEGVAHVEENGIVARRGGPSINDFPPFFNFYVRESDPVK